MRKALLADSQRARGVGSIGLGLVADAELDRVKAAGDSQLIARRLEGERAGASPGARMIEFGGNSAKR